jgi:hypothetical protein
MPCGTGSAGSAGNSIDGGATAAAMMTGMVAS